MGEALLAGLNVARRSGSVIVVPDPYDSGGPAIEHSDLAPGLNPSIYAYVKTAMHRNLFRIPIP